jgi:dihydroorotase
VVKREEHRLAVRKAAVSGSPKFFLGTDSAPHARRCQGVGCGCAGIFNAPFALESYARCSTKKARSTGSKPSPEHGAALLRLAAQRRHDHA